MTVSNRHCRFSWLLQSWLPEGTRVVIVLPFRLRLYVPVQEATRTFLAASLEKSQISLDACLKIKAEDEAEDAKKDVWRAKDVKSAKDAKNEKRLLYRTSSGICWQISNWWQHSMRRYYTNLMIKHWCERCLLISGPLSSVLIALYLSTARLQHILRHEELFVQGMIVFK